jgi:hypothetical protein
MDGDASEEDGGICRYVHLTDGARYLCPYAIDVVVQPLEREDLQRGVRLAEETDQPGGRREGDHDVWYACRVLGVSCGVVAAESAVGDAAAPMAFDGRSSRGDGSSAPVLQSVLGVSRVEKDSPEKVQ